MSTVAVSVKPYSSVAVTLKRNAVPASTEAGVSPSMRIDARASVRWRALEYKIPATEQPKSSAIVLKTREVSARLPGHRKGATADFSRTRKQRKAPES